mgnify:CR=1 FL=1|tara:strand:- start:79631 stop:81247 length:1617 start_codon:yes stop_codon:yes gene_type:complete
MTKLKIHCAQINPTVGDITGNTNLVLTHYRKACALKADLCVLPEAVICGYTPGDLIYRPQFLADIKKATLSIAKEVQETALLLSVPWVEDDRKTYNVIHFIHHGKIQQTIHKQCLPNFGVMDEKRVFTAGINDKTISLKGIKLGILVCHDTWWPEVAQALKADGAQILISANASPYELDKENFRITFCKERVKETNLPLLYTNLVGAQDEILFDGRTFTLNPQEEAENKYAAWQEQGELIVATENNGLFSFENTYNTQELSLDENIYQGLKLGLRDYMKKSGFSKALLGLSGGIDSALTAAIAVDVLGCENVTGILLPSKHTSDHSNNDALALAKNLGIQTFTLPIEETVKALESALEITGALNSITLENIQARARGTLLMGMSNNTGALLLTTGNKSEVAVGFCTLYGDMNGGFNIIKDLYKTEVYRLSRYINREKEVIPTNSITKEPTPELSPGQKDSDNLPPYEILDAILYMAIEENLSALEITQKGFEKTTVEGVLKLLKNSEYKRYQGAPGVKIHKVSFNSDRRYPLVNKYAF